VPDMYEMHICDLVKHADAVQQAVAMT
jgi:hypothetical protein